MSRAESRDEIKTKLCKLIDEAYNYDQAMSDNNVTQDDVDTLRETLISSEFVPRGIVDKYLLLGLIACDNNLDKTVTLMHNYYKFKKEAPEFFANRNIESKEIQSTLDNQHFYAFSPTPDDYCILFTKLRKFQAKNFNYDDSLKVFLMTLGRCLKIILNNAMWIDFKRQ